MYNTTYYHIHRINYYLYFQGANNHISFPKKTTESDTNIYFDVMSYRSTLVILTNINNIINILLLPVDFRIPCKVFVYNYFTYD